MNKNIKMVKGDTLAFGLEINGLGQDLEAVYFTCKKNFDDEEKTFQKTLGDGVSKVEDGVYRVRVAPEDTRNVEAGDYYYDLQFNVNGDTFTILKGSLKIENGVTAE